MCYYFLNRRYQTLSRIRISIKINESDSGPYQIEEGPGTHWKQTNDSENAFSLLCVSLYAFKPLLVLDQRHFSKLENTFFSAKYKFTLVPDPVF